MGCDIHLMVEFKGKYCWKNGGSIDVGRNYELFAILADVRNYHDIPHIEIKKIQDASSEFDSWFTSYEEDAHSPNCATLSELIKYYEDNKNKTIYNDRLIMERDKNGKILSTCAHGGSNDFELEEVGECSIFGEFGDTYFTNLITRLHQFKKFYSVKSDDDIRIIYFFDN